MKKGRFRFGNFGGSVPDWDWARESGRKLFTLAGSCGGKLQGMQQAVQGTGQSANQTNSGSFAGILAALSGPSQRSQPAWNDSGLEEDVAMLSYEHALRTHARNRRTDRAQKLRGSATPEAEAETERATGTIGSSGVPQSEAAPVSHGADGPLERNLKRASVTVRLSEAECAQLRKRAGEAGLTVSAYLRSCTFEAEALRAQVKEALAQLRAGTGKATVAGVSRERRGWRQWAGWLLHRGRAGQPVLEA